MATCGSREERFPIAPSRSGPELVKRLEDFLILSPGLDDPYSSRGIGKKVDTDLTKEEWEKFPQIRPFRSLDAGRLKLSGTGAWPLEEYLSGPLWLPYVEPDILRHGLSTKGCPMPLLHNEDWDLAMRWESLGLLRLCDGPVGEQAVVKAFNAHKDLRWDRRIGDRRRVNYMETSGWSILPSPRRTIADPSSRSQRTWRKGGGQTRLVFLGREQRQILEKVRVLFAEEG